jgi:hypothetical protein
MDMSSMQGMLGPYVMTREAAGTSWQPDATPMNGRHAMGATWSSMLHGMLDLVYDQQGGRRGGRKTFVAGMLMWMGRRPLGAGHLGVRVGLTPDLLMGTSGYPLLLQSGETADGRERLVDRQHPHDLLMEAALSYSHPTSARSAVFVYAGLPGEAALGPTVFMHRASSLGNVEAPIGHHWLDSTHITYGVVTAGWVMDRIKFEASWFNGREPDQYRENIELRRLDSWSMRFSLNPTSNWSLQLSHGRLASPEQLEPNVSVQRTTASLSYSSTPAAWRWFATAACGRNAASSSHGTAANSHATQACLLEAALRVDDRHTLSVRAESADKDELFDAPSPLAGRTFNVAKWSLGYSYRLAVWHGARLELGASVSQHQLPTAIRTSYGSSPTSGMLWLRWAL